METVSGPSLRDRTREPEGCLVLRGKVQFQAERESERVFRETLCYTVFMPLLCLQDPVSRVKHLLITVLESSFSFFPINFYMHADETIHTVHFHTDYNWSATCQHIVFVLFFYP